MSDELAPVLPFRPAKRGTVSQDSTRETTKKELAQLFVPAFDKDKGAMSNPREEAAKAGVNPEFVSPDGKDLCVLCGDETEYDWRTPVDLRDGYSEAGQLCRKCRES